MNVRFFQRRLARPQPASTVERRSQPRPAGFVAATGLRVEALEPDVAAIHHPDWAALAREALEPNVFLDPDFALSAAQHFAAARRPLFLLVRDGARLVGLCGIERNPRGRHLALWTHHYAALGAPLLHREMARDALAAMFAWLRQRWPGAEAALFPQLPVDGPVALLLRSMNESGRPLAALDSHERAILEHGAPAPRNAKTAEFLRLRRKLAQQGRLSLRLSGDAGIVRNDLERFLALEASGWKGKAGTALISHPGDAAFARAAIRQMARRGGAQIARLDLDGRPIAMGIVLRSADAAAFWKIAYAPDVAKYSPGVQLTLALSDELARDGAVRFTDSCAIANHPMINRLWSGRMEVADMLVGLDAASESGFRKALRRETLRRSLRARCKDIYLRLTRKAA